MNPLSMQNNSKFIVYHQLAMVSCFLNGFVGLELADTQSKHSIDQELYNNKFVLIIGGGNSAFEIGDYLSGTAAIVKIAFGKRIQFAWNTHYVGKGVIMNTIYMVHIG